ncbi:MAG: alpha-2-macroglobulin family protein [Alphaproteobacteria bacterium]|nr:alpha-2-macroglobulin family protein [Alphaproteobacteria bacterium]
MRRFLIIGTTAVIVLALLAGALYTLGGRGVPRGPAGVGQNGIIARIQRGFSAATGGTSTPTPPPPPEFAFHRLDIDTSKPQAEACLVFTRKLDDSGKTHYEDYLSIKPETRIVVRPTETSLCLAGLDFDKSYQVTLKQGLPAASGESLAVGETVPVTLRDKPALIRFSGGIILPRDNAEGVPVTTVNVDKLRLKVIRVGDRLLSQIESGVVDETTLYSWDEQQLEKDQGALIWSGTMTVAGVKNASVVTLIPIKQILKDRKPGAYVLVADNAAKPVAGSDDEYDSGGMAAQWVVDSDIALTTFEGANGLTVFARSYASARPLSGVKLTLVARDNNVLAGAKTDSVGRADFDPGLFRGTGGNQPVVVMAYGANGDFSFLDLRRPAFDLTDRGVGGRASPGPIDAYLYTERGVYRPGETVHAVAMLRDRVGVAASAPLTLIATRPDGVEVGRTTVPSDALAAGTAAWDVALNARAPHGRWQIAAYVDPKADPVGRVQFDVADFVPQRLNVSLTPEEKVLHPKQDLHVRAEVRFLYGAPATGLSGEGEARITADANPYPAFKNYQFGRVDDSFSDVAIPLTVPETDQGGVTTATANLGELADTTLPLKAHIAVAIHEPGGRTTSKAVDVPIVTRAVAIGIRPEFDGGAVGENAPAHFDAVAVDSSGKRIALSGLNYSWVREVTTYQWYQDNGQWKYQSTTADRLIAGGTLAISANAPAKLSQAMPWGTYRLTITDPKTGAASSYRFYSGWAASAAGDRPDRIPVAADKPAYLPGEIAHVAIKPAASGQALVVVAADRVFSAQLVSAPASGATVDIPVSADWGAGAYVLVTDYRPLDQATGREPVRAIGVAWLGVDNSSRTLGVEIGGPKLIRPRQHLTIPVKVTGMGGDSAYLTLAAVDEGILQLTNYKSPDPVGYYFGKRRLGVGMHDDYGRLIKPEKSAIGSLREGGDMLGGRTLSVVPTRTVALFSGLMKLGPDGVAKVPLDIPDFNGELRLMAVAMTGKKVGEASRALTVRDPVVADLVLPRFLAPGDHAEAALNIDNVEGPAGSYTATVTTSGPVGLDSGAAHDVMTRTLAAHQRVLIPVVLAAHGLGVANIALALKGPNGFAVSRSWPIEVRAPQLDTVREEIAPLGPGKSFKATGALVAGLIPSTVNVALNVSAAHGYSDVPGLLHWLDKYPYGCIEQTVSRAMPLLYFNDLAGIAGLPTDQALHIRIQNAVDNVLDMQNYAGDFGMWGPGSSADPWLSVFALDFLERAKAKGYVVANEPLSRGLKWLSQTASSSGNDDDTRAYAFYVLARAGRVNLSDLRYYSDTRGRHWNTAIAAALTGAAAADAGDRSRAAYAFDRAREIVLAAKPTLYPTGDYGSLVRDLAATTALAVEGGDAEIVPALMSKTSAVDLRLNATTTQDKAWMLLAAYALSSEHTRLAVLVDGKPVQPIAGAVHLSPTPGQLAKGITLANKSDGTVWRTVSVQGTSAQPLPGVADGVVLTKTFWSMDGQPVDFSSLKQNERVIVVLQGTMANDLYRQMALLDLLPAGLEIESPIVGDEAKLYPWLGEVTPASLEDARDDRFVAAFTIGSQYHPPHPKTPEPRPTFRIAYIARAVTPGQFVLPAGVVEDMYAPAIIARTGMGKLVIAAEK